jgi:hypothetical protein
MLDWCRAELPWQWWWSMLHWCSCCIEYICVEEGPKGVLSASDSKHWLSQPTGMLAFLFSYRYSTTYRIFYPENSKVDICVLLWPSITIYFECFFCIEFWLFIGSALLFKSSRNSINLIEVSNLSNEPSFGRFWYASPQSYVASQR